MKQITLSSKILNIISDFESFFKLRKNNFDYLNRGKNQFFRIQQEYDNEKTLYELTLTENFNKNGVGCEYYVISFDTAANVLYGEDTNRKYMRKFDFMGMFDLPSRARSWTQFGIEINDIYNVQVSKRHFIKASTMNPSYPNTECVKFPTWGTEGTYESIQPKIGDLIRNKYDSLYYEIIQVEDNQDEFLQRSHEWDITVRIFRDNHISTENATSRNGYDLIGTMDNKNDILDVSTFVDNKKLDSIFVNPTNTSAHADPVIYVNNTEKTKRSKLLGDW